MIEFIGFVVFIEFIEPISQIPQSLSRFAPLNAFMLLFNWGLPR
jgi:hypothetical protein